MKLCSFHVGEPEAAAASCTTAPPAFPSTPAPAGLGGAPKGLQPPTDCIIVAFILKLQLAGRSSYKALYICVPMSPSPLETSSTPGTELNPYGPPASHSGFDFHFPDDLASS